MTDFINLDAISRRLKELLDRNKMSAKDFSLETGIAPSTLSQILNGKTTINIDSINKIIYRWQNDPNFDAMWFVLGDEYAQQAKQAHSTDAALSSTNSTADSEHKALETALSSKIEEIGRLKASLEAMKPKVIDHITVFYTDKSFETYRLCADE
ncbi:MAG: helix-turn-helix transcriptional regulator [Porphyromonadaceae bacterium]|nr:helix-turn-helix transcriptional regulator [Porphyromonadaceae bacterium]